MRVVVVGPTYPEAFAENISAALARAGASVTHVDGRSLVATVLARDGVVPRAVGAFERLALEQAGLRRQLLGRPFADRVAAGTPDLVISTDGTLRREDLVEARSRLGPGVPWVLWYPDSMANLGAQDALAAGYDRLYFKDALLVRRLAAMTGLPVRFLPEACDPFRHRPVDPTGDEASRYTADLALAGNMYAYRAEILKLLPAALDLRLYGKRARNATVRDAWFTGEFVADRAKSLAFGCAVAVLNTMHYAEIESVNARLFEATGCGALVLSDWRPGIDKLFVDGDEILTFRTVDELLSRWRSIEEMSEQERQTMRARAVARAHADHAYPDRLAVVFDDLGFNQLEWVRHPDRSDLLLNVHAIVTVLNERELLNATLRGLYDYVSAITVVSAVDRDWKGREILPDGGVVDLLRREADPERKVRVVVLDETNQARVYNRIMDAEMTGAQRPVQQQHEFDAAISAPEYFMLVDADELWEPGPMARAFSFLATERPPYLQVPAWHYFGTWNYRVPDLEWFTVFVRSDQRVYHMRNPDLTRPWTKALFRAPRVSVDLALRSAGVHRVGSDVAAFHHGSYVGPRERIAAKVTWSPHAHQMRPDWLDSVWSAVTASSTNLHPTDPQAFSRVEYLPHDALPSCIRAIDWPPGYLDD